MHSDTILTGPEYEVIFESLEDAVVIFDVAWEGDEPVFRFRGNNTAHESITGIAIEDDIGKQPRELFGAEDGDAIRRRCHRCVTQEETLEYEETFDNLTDTREWHTKLTPIVENGSVSRLVGVSRDITGRKRRERKLERFETFLEVSSDITTVVDEDGTIRYESPTVEDVLGYDPEDLIGENAFEYVHPEDTAEAIQAFGEGIAESPGETHKHELRFRDADGEWRWMELRARVELDNPAVEGILINTSDITDRKRAEQELQEERDTFAQGPTVVFRREDAEELPVEYVSENVEAAFGYTPEEFTSGAIEFAEIVHEDDIERVIEEMARHSDPGIDQFVHEPYRIVTKDGETRWVLDYTTNRRENGSITHRLGYLIDITERKKRERQLRRFEAFIENSPTMVTLLDTDGTVLLDKSGIDADWRHPPEEFLETNILDYVHPDDKTRVIDAIEALHEHPGEPMSLEFRFRGRDGTWHWLRTSAVNHETDPLIEGIIAISLDITEQKEFERKLADEKDFLDTIIDSLPFPFYVLDVDDYTVAHVNSRADVRSGETCYEVTHRRDRPCDEGDVAIGCPIAEVTETGEPATVEHVHFDDAGNERIFEVHAAPIFNDDGRVIQIAESNIDVTERVEHERRLSALHGATRRLIDADSKADVADIAVEAAQELLEFSLPSVWYQNDDGEIELIANSEQHQRLLNEAGTPEPTHPADSWLRDVIETDETLVHSPIPPEKLAADVPIHSAIILPLSNHGILACATRGDIAFTDRQIQVAEILAQNVRVALNKLDHRAALERQQQFTADLLDAIEDVVYVLDTGGDMRDWNSAFEEITGYTENEIGSMNAADFFGEENADAVRAAVREAFETGRARIDLDLLTAHGEPIPYEFIANSFDDPDGHPVVGGIGRDRSRHVEYERTLEEQRDNLKILNQVVRHDIRNDMTVVRGRAELLYDHVEPSGRTHLDAVLRATNNAIELTNTTRELAESMLVTERDPEPVSLDTHLNEQIDAARSQYDDAVLTTAEPIADIQVLGDDLLGAVFRNIIQNAIIHNDKAVPRVEISTTFDDETVTVAIADNGPGIPDEQKDSIFGRGEKGLDSPGTGIGLYLVETLLDQYDGDVWIEDNEPEGSVFVIELHRVGDIRDANGGM